MNRETFDCEQRTDHGGRHAATGVGGTVLQVWDDVSEVCS